MAADLEPAVLALLESVPVGVLGTVRPDGRARQTTVYYVLDGGTVWVSTESGRAKTADVTRSGWASLCVVGPAAPYPSVTLEGPASIQRDGVAPMTGRVIARISGGDAPDLAEADLAAAGRVLLRLDVERVYGGSHLEAVTTG
jgi:PPOX class probable F420-dependent enzyme